jgi:hypothetical protein
MLRKLLLAVPAALLLASTVGAQTEPSHPCTFDFGFGGTPATPGDSNGLGGGWNFQGGGGFRAHGKSATNWSVYFTGNFLYDSSGVTPQALNSAKNLNPTNVALLQATSARERFYSVTGDLKLATPDLAGFHIYGLVGLGWLRRKASFSGVSAEGVILQPGTPELFSAGGDSAAYDVGLGVSHHVGRTWTIFLEARRVRGLAVNSGITLLPLTVGLRY